MCVVLRLSSQWIWSSILSQSTQHTLAVRLMNIRSCEVLGVVPVLYPSRRSWSFHLFLGRRMLLFLFGLYFSACLGILSVPILSTCCSHSLWHCFISKTMFCTPSFYLTDWFLPLSNLVVPNEYLKNSICPASSLCSSLFSTQASLPYFKAGRQTFASLHSVVLSAR
jgi:hypothetical protein